MSAADILKMIETVDPSDTAKLDEIDKTVEMWLMPDSVNKREIKRGLRGFYSWGKYTRSRDALKAIRPEGWIVEQKIAGDHYVFWARKLNKLGGCIKLVSSPALASLKITEELAELHAIIQAIAYERAQKP